MRLVFDLDGVLRDLYAYLNTKFNVPYSESWIWRYQNKDIFDWIREDRYSCLVYAPITEYFLPINRIIEHLELWTCQPETWRKYTKLWITANIGDCAKHYLDTAQKRAKLDEEPDTFLVEDSPNFANYDRIILIDRPYNQSVKADIRIKSPKELIPWLEKSENAKKGD